MDAVVESENKLTKGNVTPATITLFLALTWVQVIGTFGRFKQFSLGRWVFSSPGIGGNGVWGAVPYTGSPSALKIEQATMLAVANGAANPDGTFVDVSDALGAGAVDYTLYSDLATGHCVAVQVV